MVMLLMLFLLVLTAGVADPACVTVSRPICCAKEDSTVDCWWSAYSCTRRAVGTPLLLDESRAHKNAYFELKEHAMLKEHTGNAEGQVIKTHRSLQEKRLAAHPPFPS